MRNIFPDFKDEGEVIATWGASSTACTSAFLLGRQHRHAFLASVTLAVFKMSLPICGVFRRQGGVLDHQQILRIIFLRRLGKIERTGQDFIVVNDNDLVVRAMAWRASINVGMPAWAVKSASEYFSVRRPRYFILEGSLINGFAVNHERPIAMMMNGAGISLCEIDPRFDHFKDEDAVCVASLVSITLHSRLA